MVKSYHTTRN